MQGVGDGAVNAWYGRIASQQDGSQEHLTLSFLHPGTSPSSHWRHPSHRRRLGCVKRLPQNRRCCTQPLLVRGFFLLHSVPHNHCALLQRTSCIRVTAHSCPRTMAHVTTQATDDEPVGFGVNWCTRALTAAQGGPKGRARFRPCGRGGLWGLVRGP